MNRIALVPAGLCVAALLFASGDFNIGPFFTPLSSPENVDAFRHGHPGLITPALNKADEFIVFRYLSGLTLDNTDALNPVPGQPIRRAATTIRTARACRRGMQRGQAFSAR